MSYHGPCLFHSKYSLNGVFLKKNNALTFSFFIYGISDSDDFPVLRGLGLIREVLMIEPGTRYLTIWGFDKYTAKREGTLNLM
jgi:hypothetical protein